MKKYMLIRALTTRIKDFEKDKRKALKDIARDPCTVAIISNRLLDAKEHLQNLKQLEK